MLADAEFIAHDLTRELMNLSHHSQQDTRASLSRA
jgi:hypothetical protein